MVVVGGIYNPNHQTNRWGWAAVDGRTGHCPVRQPRHPTVRVLTVSTVGALTSWCTGQSGAAPDRHCSLSGAPLAPALTSATNCSSVRALCKRPCADSRCSDWCTGQSGGTPDSPVNYSGVRLEKPEAEEFEVDPPYCTGHCSVVHRTLSGGTPDSSVRQTRVLFGSFCSFLLNPNSDLFIGLC
jgi:hypothetical protein